MTRLTIRNWLAILIGSSLGIYWGILEFASAAFFSPYLSALITGLIAKKNERTLGGITVIIVYYGLLGIPSYILIQHLGWEDFLGGHRWYMIPWCFGILGLYPFGRMIGYLAVKLKGKKQTEQDIYLDLDKRLLGLRKKVEVKINNFFSELWENLSS